jgi:hypothetical protein
VIPPLFAGLGVGALVLVIGGTALLEIRTTNARRNRRCSTPRALLTEIALDDRHRDGRNLVGGQGR